MYSHWRTHVLPHSMSDWETSRSYKLSPDRSLHRKGNQVGYHNKRRLFPIFSTYNITYLFRTGALCCG